MSRVFFNIMLACSLLYLSSAIGNDYQWGTLTATSTLMARELVSRPFTFGTGTTFNYVYTQTGATAPLTIQAIRVTDRKKLRGATAAITAGGIGSTTVTITFTSSRGGAIKDLVEIYGA